MNNEEVAQKLAGQITDVQDYLDNLYFWLRYCTKIDTKEYQEGNDKVQELLEELQLFDPSKNQPKHPKMILSDSEGNVLGTSESTKDTKEDVGYYPSVTLYDSDELTIGRCDTISFKHWDDISLDKNYSTFYLDGLHLYDDKTVGDIKKVKVVLSEEEFIQYMVLNCSELDTGGIKCRAMLLNGGVENE